MHADFLDWQHRQDVAGSLPTDRKQILLDIPVVRMSPLWQQKSEPPGASLEACTDLEKICPVFLESVENLKAWVTAHGGAHPKQNSADTEEKQLAMFLCRQQQVAVSGALNPGRRCVLAAVPGMIDRMSRWTDPYKHMEFSEWLSLLASWVEEHGRCPKYGEGCATEKRLGAWLNNQRFLLEDTSWSCTSKIAQLLEIPGCAEVVERWRSPRQKFHARVRELENWVLENGRLPSTNVCRASERRVAVFMAKCRRNLLAGKMASEDCDKLCSIPGMTSYLRTTIPPRCELTFDNRLSAYVDWMAKNDGCRPKATSADFNERSLAVWARGVRYSYWRGKLPDEDWKKVSLHPGLSSWVLAEGLVSRSQKPKVQKTG